MNLGIEIDKNERGAIEEKMLKALNPENIPYGKLFETKYNSISKDDLIDKINFTESEEFYVEYTRGVKTRILLATKGELVDVLSERIDPNRSEGLDLVISPSDFSYIAITNHDGDTFLIR
jgi:hypothetical protein